VQLKARAVGLESEDYLNDKVPEATDEEASYREIALEHLRDAALLLRGASSRSADEVAAPLYLNEYVLLTLRRGQDHAGRYYGDGVVRRLKLPDFVKAPGGIPVRARNLEQQFFMDALLDDSISLVTCFGKAGTGKTLLSTACALFSRPPTNARVMMASRFPAR
jgi:PhoH-like ATPase